MMFRTSVMAMTNFCSFASFQKMDFTLFKKKGLQNQKQWANKNGKCNENENEEVKMDQ